MVGRDGVKIGHDLPLTFQPIEPRQADPVVFKPPGIAVDFGMVAVGAPAGTGDTDTLGGFGTDGGDIDIEELPVRKREASVEDLAHKRGDRLLRQCIAQRIDVLAFVATDLGDGDGGNPLQDGFHGTGCGAGVSDVLPHIGSPVDSGDHQIGAFALGIEFVQRQKDAVGGGAVVKLEKVIIHFDETQGACQGQRMAAGRLLKRGCDDGDMGKRSESLKQCMQAGGIEAIVVGDEDLFHGWVCLAGKFFCYNTPKIIKDCYVQKEPMLESTYQKLILELEQLKNIERAAIAKVIDEARALGDLKENAEYHAAKEKQGLMEARIIELTDLTGRAQVIDPSTLAHERVSFGSTVVLVDQATDEELTYTVVGSQESDPNRGLISLQSPMARALIGKEEGDEVSLQLPGGTKTYDIEAILYREIVL